MKCDKCGTCVNEANDDGEQLSGGIIYSKSHTETRCLVAQLASMTKRTEDAERGALETIKAHATEKIARLAAEAKLATAVEGLREIAGRALSYAGWAAECARSTLRALGIDPSKEQG